MAFWMWGECSTLESMLAWVPVRHPFCATLLCCSSKYNIDLVVTSNHTCWYICTYTSSFAHFACFIYCSLIHLWDVPRIPSDTCCARQLSISVGGLTKFGFHSEHVLWRNLGVWPSPNHNWKFEPSPRAHTHSDPIINKHTEHLKGPLATSKWRLQ